MMASESVLSYYWELASPNEEERVKAADGLVKTLIQSQDKYLQQGESEEPLCKDLDYSIKRLGKGLGSSRKGARQGFATALAEILHQFKCISPTDIMKLLEEHLRVTGSLKSQAERDAYIGHVFGLMSVVRSNELTTKTKAKECTWLEQVVSTLKHLSEKKEYLIELCMKVIVDIINMVSYDVFEQHVLPSVRDSVYGGWPTASPDSLLVALSVQRRFEKNLDKKTFKKAWNSVDILDKENYSKLSNVLQESTSAHPNVHSVWDEVLSWVFQDGSECFEDFWRIVVDDGLFESTHGRRYLGFSLISKILPKLQADQVPMVLSKNVMRSFINNLSSNQNYLHNAATHLSSSMLSALVENDDPEVTAVVLMQLLGRHGHLQFDTLTKTKTVETLLEKLQESGLERLASWFIECFKSGSVGNTEDETPSLREVDVTRISILNQILSLSKKQQQDHSGSWRKKLLFFLIEMSYFKLVDSDNEDIKIPLSKQVRETCEHRLFSIIKDLGTPHGKQESTSKNDKENEKHLWMFTIIKHLKELLSSDDYAVSSHSWTENTKKTFEQTVKVVTRIHKKQKDGTATPEDKAFELLMSHVVLQLFTEPKQATDILEELKLCYKNRQDKEKGQQSSDEPHWVEVLIEILLSLLTRPSNLLRHVVVEVFTAIAPHLTSDALGIILQAIDPKNVGEEEDENLEVIDASDDEDMNPEDAEEKDDDEDGNKVDENNDDDDDDVDDSDDEEEDDDGNQVDEAFRAEVLAALGAAALPDDDKEGNVEEEDLDDESMMQMDDALAAIFKTRAEAKKNKKDKPRTILHFKLRVLDIVEIFIKKQSTNPLVLDLVEPLLSLAWTTLNVKDYQTLGERAQGIYKNKLCAIKEPPSLATINADDVHTCLDTLVHKAMSAPSLNVVMLVTRGCMLLIRVLRGKAQDQPTSATKKRKHDDESQTREIVGVLDVSRVAELFKEALKDFMEKRTSRLHPVLFTELIKRFPFLGWELAPELAKNIDNAVNNFRKTQACVMLTSLISFKISCYAENLEKLAPTLQKTLISVLEESTKPDTSLKVKHFKEVLKLMGKFYKEINMLNEEKEIVDSSSVVEGLQKAAEGVLASRSQDIKATCRRLISLLQGASGTAQQHSQPNTKKPKKESHPNGTQTSDSTQSSPKQKEEKKKNKKKDKK